MDIKELNQRYEEIIHSNRPENIKTNQLSMLMTYMEGEYQIPMLKNPEWESNNRKVIALYRKISMSRVFEE
ncbi:hypothetical protein [Alkalicoccobacillus gibsonii]|jgi:hypothetical protein|uniref:hypothetical protein n=1 Tax=Alkalicoccobacillus gibsonii TaxID=79881 RepID=UPI001932EE34|nr:hypothetical protein [Alkalicoccobacillus gibsonii]MBM0067934.1 hypothetical protein [Alkalicoccobacillus gibsonii]